MHTTPIHAGRRLTLRHLTYPLPIPRIPRTNQSALLSRRSIQGFITIITGSSSPSNAPAAQPALRSYLRRRHPPPPWPHLCTQQNEIKLELLQHAHDSPSGGHYGYFKTLEVLTRDYHWPGMRKYVREYCKTCNTCNRSKPIRHAPLGNSIHSQWLNGLGPPSPSTTSRIFPSSKINMMRFLL
jgi:hypothetical protein